MATRLLVVTVRNSFHKSSIGSSTLYWALVCYRCTGWAKKGSLLISAITLSIASQFS